MKARKNLIPKRFDGEKSSLWKSSSIDQILRISLEREFVSNEKSCKYSEITAMESFDDKNLTFDVCILREDFDYFVNHLIGEKCENENPKYQNF